MRILRSVTLLLCMSTFMLIGCDGESRPFEEAVEVRDLQVTALSVIPPANSQPAIFLNSDESVQLGIQGLRADGTNLTLSGTGRLWSVSDTSVADIDTNGLLSARADGITSVFVNIGDLVSSPFTLTVRNATLSAIESIDGDTSIERCLPQNYQAVGRFSDNSLRNLNAVSWSIANAVNAQVVTNADATATLTGLNSSELLLSAAVGSIISTPPASIIVLDTLSALAISPSPASVAVGGTQRFTATGIYIDEPTALDTPGAATRSVVITESVNWSVTSDESNATVSNVAPNSGTITGVVAGNALLSASCGALADNQTITISSPDTSGQLSFNVDDPFFLSQSNTAGFQLRVSTGSTFSVANEVTQVNDNVIWGLTTTGTTTPIVALLETGVNAGLIQPLATGPNGATVSATFNNQTISIGISVVTP